MDMIGNGIQHSYISTIEMATRNLGAFFNLFKWPDLNRVYIFHLNILSRLYHYNRLMWVGEGSGFTHTKWGEIKFFETKPAADCDLVGQIYRRVGFGLAKPDLLASLYIYSYHLLGMWWEPFTLEYSTIVFTDVVKPAT